MNNDIHSNLVEPLAEIKEAYAGKGITIPDIQVFTRSGDTPQNERQRMLRHPPEILITTPESLNLILSSKRARLVLTTITGIGLQARGKDVEDLWFSRKSSYY